MARWAVLSAGLAPVVLIGGWTVAARHQPAGYDAARDTISALAARGATDRWLMTSALAVLGACHLVTALGLRAARPAGRVLLAIGGIATLVVSAAPQPHHGSSRIHVAAALLAFVLLGLWAVAASRSDGRGPLSLRVGTTATAVLLGMLVWFGVSTATGSLVGVSERGLAGAQSVWPLVVVVAVRRRGRNRDRGD